MDRTVFCTVITVPSRKEEVEQTLLQLAGAGIYPAVLHHDDAPSEMGHTAMSKLAPSHFLQSDCERFLFLEDDIDVDEALFVEAIQKSGGRKIVSLYLPGQSFYPARLKRRLGKETDDLEIFKIINQKNYFGSQAILLSRQIARRLFLSCWTGQFDTMLPKMDTPIYSVFPNVVQHRSGLKGEKSVISSKYKPHYSRSFRGR